MKRIPQSIAVTTLTYGAHSDQSIKIIDLDVFPTNDNTKKEVVYDGFIGALVSYKYAKMMHSKVVGWHTETCKVGNGMGTCLVVEICTKQDSYY